MIDDDKARLIAFAARAHAQGAVIRLLLAYIASKEPEPKRWLGHCAALMDKEIKGTVTSPDLTDEETLLAMNVGLATLRELFKIDTERLESNAGS
jgi:hypothetical protein